MTEDFWEWLPRAYRDGNVGDEPKFTKYDMETAFAAGAEAEAKRMWVGLTRDERMDIINRLAGQDWVYVVDAIEAKLKEKNS